MRLGLLLAFALLPFGDSRSHVRLTLQGEGQAATPELVRTLQARLDRLDVDGTVEAGQGGRIVVDMPRVEDPERVRRLLTRSVSLELRFVRFPEGGGGNPSREAVLQHFGGQLPPELELLEGQLLNEEGIPTGRQFYAVERTRIVTARDIRNARPGLGQFNQPIVQFSLTPEAGQAFGRATEANLGSGIAIVLDGEVLSAPKVVARITDEGILEGGFSEQEVQELAILLGSGPLPARVRVVDQQVSAAVPDRRFWLAMTALAVFFVLFVATLVALYLRGGRPRPPEEPRLQ